MLKGDVETPADNVPAAVSVCAPWVAASVAVTAGAPSPKSTEKSVLKEEMAAPP
jgi:hypothetical protein